MHGQHASQMFTWLLLGHLSVPKWFLLSTKETINNLPWLTCKPLQVNITPLALACHLGFVIHQFTKRTHGATRRGVVVVWPWFGEIRQRKLAWKAPQNENTPLWKISKTSLWQNAVPLTKKHVKCRINPTIEVRKRLTSHSRIPQSISLQEFASPLRSRHFYVRFWGLPAALLPQIINSGADPVSLQGSSRHCCQVLGLAVRRGPAGWQRGPAISSNATNMML